MRDLRWHLVLRLPALWLAHVLALLFQPEATREFFEALADMLG